MATFFGADFAVFFAAFFGAAFFAAGRLAAFAAFFADFFFDAFLAMDDLPEFPGRHLLNRRLLTRCQMVAASGLRLLHDELRTAIALQVEKRRQVGMIDSDEAAFLHVRLGMQRHAESCFRQHGKIIGAIAHGNGV